MADMEASDQAPKLLHSKEVSLAVLSDIEQEMVDVRMASSAASLAARAEATKASDIRCNVSIRSLALSNYARMLAAAQAPTAEGYIEDNYGPLFPMAALEASDGAAKRWSDAESYDRTQRAPIADPLAPPAGSAAAERDAQIQQRGGGGAEESIREGKPSGFTNSVVSSMVDVANRTKEGWTNRGKRATAEDVEEERRNLAASSAAAGPQSRPVLRGKPSPAAAPAAAAADEPSRPVVTDGDPLGDPLAAPGRRVTGGFGADPLAPPPPRQSASTPNVRDGDLDDDDDDDDGDYGSSQSSPRGGPLQRSTQRAAAPQRAPPRRAPPAPGARPAPPPRRAPPAPGAAPQSRPAPLRPGATPGRPAPLPPGRAAPPGRAPPARPAPRRPGDAGGRPDQLPL